MSPLLASLYYPVSTLQPLFRRPLFKNEHNTCSIFVVRVIIDEASRIANSAPVVVEMCQSIIAWAEAEERTFLRLNLQAKLASALFDTKKVTIFAIFPVFACTRR